MKKLRRILFLLLLMPLCFSFVSCKDKSTDSDGGTGGSGGSGGSGGGSGGGNVSAECFSVAYDYNLPEKYDYLLSDYTDANNEVGTSVSLISIIDDNLAPHFLGWYNEDDELVTEAVTSDEPTTIKLKGKWNEENIDKYYYTKGLSFNVANGEASVAGYNGSATKVILPKVYNFESVDYEVTEIGESVFEGSNVSKFIVNTEFLSIGKAALKDSKITEFDFEKVKVLGESAFENTKISEVTFSNSLTNIGKYAFNNCYSLEKVDLAQAEIIVSEYAFHNCLKLETIENAKNLRSISNYSFVNCKELNDLSFLEDNTKLSYIGINAFEDCTGLISAFIPESVTLIVTPFIGCSNIQELNLARTYATESNGSDTLIAHIGDISSSLKTINFFGTTASILYENYFNGLTNLKTFVMCDSISIVQNYAFSECINLENVTLSNGIALENFSYNAFYNTKYLKDRTEPLIFKNSLVYIPTNIVAEYAIPNNVTSIGASAFANRTTLQKIIIPASVETIGDKAFEGCSNLKEVVFEVNNKITELGDLMFSSCYSLDTIDLTKLTALAEIGNQAFERTSISNVVIPSTVASIGSAAFMHVEVLSFEISGTPNKFVVIDNVLYEDVSSQGDGTSLKLLAYPKLKTNELFVCPSNVSAISSGAFAGAGKLKYVYFEHETIEWESRTAFTGTSGIKVLKEKAAFEVEATGVSVYNFVSSPNCQYDGETVVLVGDYEPPYGNCFLKEPGSVNGKYTIVIFNYDFDAGELGTVTVLENAV